MVPPLVARDVEADPGFMLFYYALKYTEEGKINFTKVASSMCLDTAGAAYDLAAPDNQIQQS